jgi:hypothetical protein
MLFLIDDKSPAALFEGEFNFLLNEGDSFAAARLRKESKIFSFYYL